MYAMVNFKLFSDSKDSLVVIPLRTMAFRDEYAPTFSASSQYGLTRYHWDELQGPLFFHANSLPRSNPSFCDRQPTFRQFQLS
jgi:hypothetical protein